MLLAAAEANDSGILCLLLLIAVIVLFILGLIELVGHRSFLGGRYAACIGFVIALVLYIVLC